MKATIKETAPESRVATCRKDKGFFRQYSMVTADGSTPVVARFYQPGESVVYCCVWVHGSMHRSGGGKAGGYGYHRASAALQDALANAGIELDSAIAGRGDSAMESALRVVARKVSGKRNVYTIAAHA